MANDTPAQQEMTPSERQAFEHEGFLIRRDVFAPDEIDEIVAACEALVAELVTGREQRRRRFGSYVFDSDIERSVVVKWEGDSDVVHGLEPFAHLSPPLESWGYDERLLAPMRDMLGHDDLELYTEKLNLKRPRVGGVNPLHQDYPYWVDASEDAKEIVTTIIFLDDATIENGCLWVVPGSHRDGPWQTRTDGDAFASNEIDVTRYPTAEEVPVELAAGSTLSFGSLLVHRSAPNTSDKNRRALLYSYQPAGRRKQIDNFRSRPAST